jgi:hypothetical protein
VQEDDLDNVAYVEAKVPWITLDLVSILITNELLKIPQDTIKTLKNMLIRHESFLQTYRELPGSRSLHDLLVRLFTSIFELVLKALSYFDVARPFNIGAVLIRRTEFLKVGETLRDLDRSAQRLEDSIKMDALTDQQQDILRVVGTISDDVSYLREEVQRLTGVVQLLVEKLEILRY